MENILIRADEIGLGSCWLGVYPVEERMNDLKTIFNMPKNIQPLGIAVIGKSAEIKENNNRFLENKVYFETF